MPGLARSPPTYFRRPSGTRGKQERGPKVRSERIRLARGELADSVKSIIESRGLSLHAISQKSEIIFGHASPHFVPHNFYYELTLGTYSPSLHQLFALSSITGYRLFDWLHVFGLDPEQISRLQLLRTTKRTVLLDSTR